LLTLNQITMRLGGHVVLDHASATLPSKSRVGLIGRNGAGKSTLLKIIAGIHHADGGTVGTPRGTRIGYIAQDMPGGAATPFETVLAADTERARLMIEAESAQDAHRIGAIHERLDALDAYAAPARASRILAGLGFDDETQHHPLSSFSGGWRMRVALAALLFSRPDLLLLDEPSNHLDLEAVIWLESFLKTYRGTVIVVSHERDFLNNITDHILHLEGGRTTLYSGSYDSFERQRCERQAQADAMRMKQEAKRKKVQAYVDRWRYKAHTARQAQSRLKALARMAPVTAAAEDASILLDFPSPNGLRPPLATLEDASVGYVADKPVLSNLNFRIDPDDRIALLGRNGNGKTTLARLLSGSLKAMSGTLTTSAKMNVGYFAQHQIEELEPDDSPLQHMVRLLPDARQSVVRAQLGRFGFSGDKANLKVHKLSGGERARLALALITRDAPHMLILDEPTNHLDIDTREALVEGLNAYGGAVIIISHDRHLLELTADRLILIDNGTALEFDGSLDDYRDFILGRGNRNSGVEEDKPAPRTNRKEERRRRAELRERTQTLRKKIAKAEHEIAGLEKQIAEIDRALLEQSAYEGPHKGIPTNTLVQMRAKIDKQRLTTEAGWLKSSQAMDETTKAETLNQSLTP